MLCKYKVMSIGRNFDKTYTYDLRQDMSRLSVCRVYVVCNVRAP